MSDLDNWQAFFDIYGIKYVVDKKGKGGSDTKDKIITLNTDEGNGYRSFTMCIEFNSDGSFRDYGVWE